MGKFSLEQKIKDRLKGHEVHIDKRELWKGLGIEEEEKDRKAIWFWWSAGVVGLLLIGSIWWFTSSSPETENIQQFSSTENLDESIAKTGNEKIKEESTVEKLSEIIDEVRNEKSNEDQARPNEHDNNPVMVQENVTATSITQAQNNKQNTALIDFRNSTEGTKNNKETNINSSFDNDKEEEGISNEMEALPPYAFVDVADIQSRISPLNFHRIPPILRKEVKPVIKPITAARRFELEVFGGVGRINRQLDVVYGDFEGYKTIRDTSEIGLEHISVGISFKYKLGKGFYGKAGLSINRWNEKFSYKQNSDTIITPQEIPDVILVDLLGNETITYKDGEAWSYNEITWIRYNRLTQIDVPITIGYEKAVNRWSVFGEATALINLNQRFSGYFYSTNLDVTKDSRLFNSRVGVNMGLNAGVGYGITPRLRARLSARYYKSLNSVIHAESGLDQRYTSIGLRFGLGYEF